MKKKASTKKITEKPKKKEIKKKSKTTLNPARKITTKKKEQKRVKTKEKKTAAKKVKAKIEKKLKKIIKKVVSKIEKKPKKIVKKVITKIKEEPEKVVKKVVAKIIEKTKKVAKKVVVKVEKKLPLEAIKGIKPRKIIEKPKKKVEAKIKEKPRKIVKKVEAEVELKKPVIEEKYPPMPLEILPTEYGENNITLMTVDPNKLFTFWEVREDTLAMHEGNLNVRVYDVTGVEFDGTNANSYFDIAVNERIGSRYIDVSPEKEFITDIGIIYFEGIFITVARSNKVSTPPLTVSEEGMLPQKLYETGLRIGY
jgi:hypothetical protein